MSSIAGSSEVEIVIRQTVVRYCSPMFIILSVVGECVCVCVCVCVCESEYVCE